MTVATKSKLGSFEEESLNIRASFGDHNLPVHTRIDGVEKYTQITKADVSVLQVQGVEHAKRITTLETRERQDFRPVVVMLRVVSVLLALILAAIVYVAYLGHLLVARG